MEILYEEKNIKLGYDQFALGMQYRVWNSNNKLRTIVSFATFGEAKNYYDKMITGGVR